MRNLLALLFTVVLAGHVSATEDPCIPAKPTDETRRVFEYVDLLSASEERALDEKLQRFSAETSNRIIVVVVDDLCDYDAAEFAQRILETWGVGKQGLNNGVVVLVKPTGGSGQRKVFISTGYGMEGAIPDATCKQIVEDQILPEFKAGRFAAGLEKGTNTLMALAKGEVNAAELKSERKRGFSWLGIVAVLFFILFAIVVKRSQVRGYAQRNGIGFWAAWWLLNEASRSHSGRWGGFSGGGGGGFGGGGFGGGSGGGGGAGGSW